MKIGGQLEKAINNMTHDEKVAFFLGSSKLNYLSDLMADEDLDYSLEDLINEIETALKRYEEHPNSPYIICDKCGVLIRPFSENYSEGYHVDSCI